MFFVPVLLKWTPKLSQSDVWLLTFEGQLRLALLLPLDGDITWLMHSALLSALSTLASASKCAS